MTEFLQYVISAVSLGCTYALAALGIALIFGVMNLINFAQGSYILIGAYVLIALTGSGPVVAILGACLAVTVLALATERVAFRPLRQADPTTLLVTSFAVSVLIQSGLIVGVGAQPESANFLPALSDPLTLGALRISKLDAVTILLTIVLLGALTYCIQRTRLGIQIRAASEDFSMARLLGVNADRVIAIAFIASGLLAVAVAIIYLAKNGAATPALGLQLVLVAFVATVIGGLGSLYGAAIAAFGIGCVSVALEALLPSDLVRYDEAFVYVVVIIVLLFRPQGLFGTYLSNQRV
jgi:branched-chain amino acid transport system permease protein